MRNRKGRRQKAEVKNEDPKAELEKRDQARSEGPGCRVEIVSFHSFNLTSYF